MEHFMMMVAPWLVVVFSLVFLFVFACRYKDPSE
ncbi:cytochrome bd oxidase small subunit CydS [Paenibacillus sanfengchensis]